MIKKTLYTSILLLLSYNFFLIKLAPDWWHASQNQLQDNVVKAQNFIYNDNTYKNVVVGSSLSCRLVIDSLPETFNLSFGGLSIFDGLKIMTHSFKQPYTVFIETNVVLRGENQEFTSDIYSPIFFYPRKIIPSLRIDKKPLGIIGKQILKKIVMPIYWSPTIYKFKLWRESLTKKNTIDHIDVPDLIEEKSIENENVETNSAFSIILNRQIQEYSIEPNEGVLNERFTDLKKYISKLEDLGTNIVFFEMPIDEKLGHLPLANISRETFYKQFPKKSYRYITCPDTAIYQTSDGVHLGGPSALKYTLFLRSEFNEISQ